MSNGRGGGIEARLEDTTNILSSDKAPKNKNTVRHEVDKVHGILCSIQIVELMMSFGYNSGFPEQEHSKP